MPRVVPTMGKGSSTLAHCVDNDGILLLLLHHRHRAVRGRGRTLGAATLKRVWDFLEPMWKAPPPLEPDAMLVASFDLHRNGDEGPRSAGGGGCLSRTDTRRAPPHTRCRRQTLSACEG